MAPGLHAHPARQASGIVELTPPFSLKALSSQLFRNDDLLLLIPENETSKRAHLYQIDVIFSISSKQSFAPQVLAKYSLIFLTVRRIRHRHSICFTSSCNRRGQPVSAGRNGKKPHNAAQQRRKIMQRILFAIVFMTSTALFAIGSDLHASGPRS